MDACKIRFRDLNLGFHAERGKGLADHALDSLADLRVVFLARHEHQAGIKAMEKIAAQQHAHPRPLLQADDAGDDAVEFGNARLK